jgi:hypothetical protein
MLLEELCLTHQADRFHKRSVVSSISDEQGIIQSYHLTKIVVVWRPCADGDMSIARRRTTVSAGVWLYAETLQDFALPF